MERVARLLHEIFAETAHLYPDRVAIRMAGVGSETALQPQLTYAELRARASRFSHYLRDKGVGTGDRVLIYLPRGLDSYMAILGILEAGAAYIPVDWSSPAQRARDIALGASVRLVVTMADRCRWFLQAEQNVISLDNELGDIAAFPLQPVPEALGIGADSLAYIIYTSGSTGQPKGAMITHRNIVFQVASEATILRMTPDDVVYGGASLAFDMSVEEAWSAFYAGATLVVPTEVAAKSVCDLPALFATHRVTVWCPVPSLLATISSPLPTLRLINVGGEACPAELARRWAPRCRMINTYGPTETTVSATWAELDANAAVTIGKPLPGYSVYVVDDCLRPVEDGQEGELLIGGLGVGAGYWNDPALTEARYIYPPFAPSDRMYRSGDLARVNGNGDLEFRGRKDLQIKLRGYRIDLNEIEAVLIETANISHAAVIPFGSTTDPQHLIAFVVPAGTGAISIERLKEVVAERLPVYMRPYSYVVQESLPTTTSGKLDRRALRLPKALVMETRMLEVPEDYLEALLLDVWKEIFPSTPISVTDDFFDDLGGHSLKAAQMVSRARRQRALAAISIPDLYIASSIRALAGRMRERTVTGKPSGTFQDIGPWRYRICAAMQALASILVFTLCGLQWSLPYLVYTLVSTHIPDTRLPAFLAAALACILAPPLVIALSISFKWLVIGRYKPGDYPLWGVYYFRWWLVRRMLAAVPIGFLTGTPFLAVYFRLLGARVGSNSMIRTSDIDAADLVSIGSNVVIGKEATIATTSVECGLLRIGSCSIGNGAVIGTMAVLARDTRVGDDAVLEDMSALPAGSHISAGEAWRGSPAGPVGHLPKAPERPKPSRFRRVGVTLGLMIAAALLPLVAVLPIAPGLIGMIELDWASPGYSYILLSPVLAVTYVLLTCLFMVGTKWLLLGRVKAGSHSIWSWFYVRFWFTQQLGELALDLLHPLYATLYVAPWYRALGAKIGARAEISTAASLVHDLVEISTESFIADGVVFGDSRIDPDRIHLCATSIGFRSFIGNSALVPAGSAVGDNVLIGVLSHPPDKPGLASAPGSTWFGLPPIHMPNRQVFTQFDEGARFKPSLRLILMRLAIEFVRITLPLTCFIVLFCLLLTEIGDLSDLPNGIWWIVALFPFSYMSLVTSIGLLVVAIKWLVMGKYRPTTVPLWSAFVWRTELVTAIYENLAVPLLLEPLRGTPFIGIFLRLLGCTIGRRVFIDTTDITEFDLVSIGNDAALNDGAGLQTHLFEDRVMKVGKISLGACTVVGSRAIVLCDAVMEDGAQIGDLSVLMKGELLPSWTIWEGSPAKPSAI